LIAALAVALVMIIVVAVAVRAVLFVDREGVTPPAPASTAPSPEPMPTGLAPTETPSEPDNSAAPEPGESTVPAECAQGDPTARQPHPADGRIHGGGLSFPKTAGFIPTEQQPNFTWAYDLGGQDRAVEEQWYSTYVVGAVSTVDGFDSPKRAAEMVMNCTVASGLYHGFTGRTEMSSSPAVVDKKKGWALVSEVRVDNPQVSVLGDTVVVIVIDTDAPESLAMFWACVPIGDNAALEQLQAVAEQLQVE
jgi:hypothetical protein